MTDHTRLTKQQKVMTMLGTLLGMLLAALDQTIVSTAGPSIQRDLHIEPSLYAWLTTSYLVASAVMTPVWGKLSDLFGRRRILVQGISVFLVGSLLCGLSQTTTQLIAARVVQGLGSAALFTTAFAVIADIFSPRERGRYAGLFGAVFGLSSVVGPLVGGLITDAFGWHWCFLINLPVGAIALGVILTRMPPLLSEARSKTIDFAGAVTFALAIVPLLLALSLGKLELREGDVGYLWNDPPILAMVACFVVFSIAFFLVERRATEPLIDLQLFRNRAFAVGNLASLVGGMAFLGAIVFLPLFMVNVVGASATRAGLTTTPLTFGIVFGNIFAGQVSSRVGRYKFLILGAIVVQMAGFALMAFSLSPDVTSAGMAARMVLIGLGLGPAIPLFNVHISSAVSPHQIGAATSTATLARSLGSTMGIAIFGNLFGLTLVHGLEEKMAVATAGLPPAMVAQWQSQQGAAGGGGEEGAPAGQSFDAEAIKKNIAERFARQRNVVDAALGNDDPAALQELARAPLLDERVRSVVDAGGIGKAIGAGFDATQAAIEQALQQGPEGLAALLADPSLPPPVKERLASVPPAALASPEARAGILAGVTQGLAEARAAAIGGARTAALTAAKKGLDDGERTAVDAVDKMARALKEAFTDATARVYFIAIFFALAGLLVALFLPELPLRGGPGGGEGATDGTGPAPPALE
jgi:EmrB/QacA subfamily drug resistance transporter